ncbi:nodulation protein [Comamonas serinivorans]|uniref:Nodulation protein n=1 Tax=Comamonas serinivorans TaxID=1082851 RepID=A0A1Y0EMM2_9BURK|nr:efflux RND transporter permease subunit [Comamonas serinivorans]ARU04579.1 nodulation protein [Comamonas serinivorans]
MNLARPFIERPIATLLLTIGLAIAGIGAFFALPVARLPSVDFPVIVVSASMPGASPADMARSVATPLERYLGVISGVNEMTSNSSTGSTSVVLQFDLGRDIDSAARDVQAAINAARTDLPTNLRAMPTWRKMNPAGMPFLTFALTSPTRTPGQIYDEVNNVLSQRLLQVDGVGDVTIGGGSQPAVRIELNPFALNDLGVSGEDVRAAIQANNANRPKGVIEIGGTDDGRALQVMTPAPGLKAADYRDLIVVSRANGQVRLSDVARVTDGVQDSRTLGLFNGQPAVIVNITQAPNANLIATTDAIYALLPSLRAQLPADVSLSVTTDRTESVRASLHEVEITLVVAIALVVLVVGLFLRNLRAAVIPAVATVVSLLGTFAVMYALGYSLNNITLMALTVATGFVVDDAIVVLENVARHMEAGMSRRKAALIGAREVGFTVLSISLSLVAVFIPLLFMGGQTGPLFQAFAVSLSAAVMISLVISLTTTPMLCALLLKLGHRQLLVTPEGRLSWRQRLGVAWHRIRHGVPTGHGVIERGYARVLDWALAMPWLVVALLVVTVGLNVYLFAHITKGYFPEQDNGQLMGGLRADQSISATAMNAKLTEAIKIIHADPDVESVVGFSGGRSSGSAFLSATLKPLGQGRTVPTRDVVNRLRPQLSKITGLQVFLNPVQELRAGGRSSNSTYQYTLKSDNQATLDTWGQRLMDQMATDARLTDVDGGRPENNVETFVKVDRDLANQLGVSPSDINSALYNAFGQRSVATMYADLNQYSVIMEWQQRYAQSPLALKDVYVPAQFEVNTTTDDDDRVSANPGQANASTGQALSSTRTPMVPLSAFASFSERPAPNSVRHDGGELSVTLSFNLADGVSLEQGRQAVQDAENAIGMPNSVRGAFAGIAGQAQSDQSNQVVLIVAALVVVYIVLGILYESLIHPITVLTTLPSAGVGALLALLALGMAFDIMALIGLFLLIGIVKKNAIMIIDFALDAERARGLTAVQAVKEACMLRFRPIVMTTLAAGLGALPLAIGFGQGFELRQPLGVTIVGGLIVSQVLTLVTTPVVYVLMDKLRRKADERHLARDLAADPADAGAAADVHPRPAA